MKAPPPRLFVILARDAPVGLILFLYFAMQGSRFPTSYKGTWTAVSRAPWLHALVLWPHGDTWGGGGRFLAPRKVALRTGMPLTSRRAP